MIYKRKLQKKNYDLEDLKKEADREKEELMKSKDKLNKQEKDMALKKEEEEEIQLEVN